MNINVTVFFNVAVLKFGEDEVSYKIHLNTLEDAHEKISSMTEKKNLDFDDLKVDAMNISLSFNDIRLINPKDPIDLTAKQFRTVFGDVVKDFTLIAAKSGASVCRATGQILEDRCIVALTPFDEIAKKMGKSMWAIDLT